jgi:hypothetical protein
MKDAILHVLQDIHATYGEECFTNPTQFKNTLGDVLGNRGIVSSEAKRIRNLLNIAIVNMQAYTRIKEALLRNELHFISNLVSEMEQSYDVKHSSAKIIVGCIAMLLKNTVFKDNIIPAISKPTKRPTKTYDESINKSTKKLNEFDTQMPSIQAPMLDNGFEKISNAVPPQKIADIKTTIPKTKNDGSASVINKQGSPSQSLGFWTKYNIGIKAILLLVCAIVTGVSVVGIPIAYFCIIAIFKSLYHNGEYIGISTLFSSIWLALVTTILGLLGIVGIIALLVVLFDK